VWEVSVEDISKAYRKLARFCHPDKVGGMSDEDAARAEKAYETLRLAKDCLSKEDSRGPYVREHCQFLKPDTSALEIKSANFTESVDRSRPPLCMCVRTFVCVCVRAHACAYPYAPVSAALSHPNTLLIFCRHAVCRVKEVEREQRKEVMSMRTTESKELSSTVAQEMEKKRKLAELKKLQVGRPKCLCMCVLGNEVLEGR
jgi:hypothetical protein